MIYQGKTYALVEFGKGAPVCRRCDFGRREGYGCTLPVGESDDCTLSDNIWKGWQEVAPTAFGCLKRAQGGERCEQFCDNKETCLISHS